MDTWALASTPSSTSTMRQAAERNESFFYKRERASDDPQVKPERRFVGPNQWPQLRWFKDRALTYADAMDDLAMRLLPAMSEALDLPEDYFTQRFTPSQFSVRFALSTL